MERPRIRIGPTQQKILTLLLAGISVGLSGNPMKAFTVLGELGREWEKIDRQATRRAIASLYKNKLADVEEQNDGSVKLTLTDNGKTKALSFKLNEMKIKKPTYWDKKWRVVVFDIPERSRVARDTLRTYLRQLGFYQLQRSVFVIPYECKDELEFLVELYGIRKHVRQFIATGVDNELHLKDIFELS